MFIPPEAPFLGFAAEQEFYQLLSKCEDKWNPEVWAECADQAGYAPPPHEIEYWLSERG